MRWEIRHTWLFEVVERESEILLMYVRARVSAPAMLVVGVRVEGGVVRRSRAKEASKVDWMCLKGL